MKSDTITLSALILFCSVDLIGQSIEDSSYVLQGTAYFDWAPFFKFNKGTASLNYELPVNPHTLLRIGLGYGYHQNSTAPTDKAIGLLSTVNLLTPVYDHRFEVGIGGSINSTTTENRGKNKPVPAVVIGYRYQPYDQTFVVRAGMCYTYTYGFPWYISVGTTIPTIYEINSTNNENIALRLYRAVYIDIITVMLLGNVSINYEEPIFDFMNIKIGYGYGYWIRRLDSEADVSDGLMLMMTFLTSKSGSSGDYGLGFSFNKQNQEFLDGRKIVPSFTVGYRFTPETGGFLFRFGLGYTYLFGAGLYLGFGSTF